VSVDAIGDDAATATATTETEAEAVADAAGVWLRRDSGYTNQQGRNHCVHHANHRRSIRNHGRPQRHRGEPEEKHLQEAEGRQGTYLLATSREVRISLVYTRIVSRDCLSPAY